MLDEQMQTQGIPCIQPIGALMGNRGPERESDLPKALHPYHSWSGPGFMAPTPALTS